MTCWLVEVEMAQAVGGGELIGVVDHLRYDSDESEARKEEDVRQG